MTQLQTELESRGYKKHISPSYRILGRTDTLFQKCISDDMGKKYYIDIWYYAEGRRGETNLPESIQAEVQFHNGDGVTDETMNVQLFTRDLDKIEEVFENMWVKLGLNYYERWS